ncbi:phosphatase PAP2 family protein [Tianweitania sediminis]|uniref:Phosphatase PAP2 family protein n=1 Tax=Tianweitania sediminis TaxID=1502156 RepID=A0A8J7R1N2_9HYPH|nr:phosphatase PAP2 family protein [Tianweitania sediminis]MBP0439048.1 phosphatase PAP2 family protein [Tianweitania sediminis]
MPDIRPDPLNAQTGRRSVSPRHLLTRFRQGHAKIRMPVGEATDPVWAPAMTVIAWSATLLIVVLSFFDGEINAAVRANDNALRDFMANWTDLVRSQWYLVPAAFLVLFAGVVDWGEPHSSARRVWSNLYAQAGIVFAAVAGSLMTTNILKIIFGRARPVLYEQFGSLHLDPFTVAHDFASFPSGHSTTAAALTVILMAWLPRFRWLFLGAGLFMAATRVAADAHYPSDIVGGFTVGFLFTLALARWLARREVAFRIHPGELLPVPRFRKPHVPPMAKL